MDADEKFEPQPGAQHHVEPDLAKVFRSMAESG